MDPNLQKIIEQRPELENVIRTIAENSGDPDDRDHLAMVELNALMTTLIAQEKVQLLLTFMPEIVALTLSTFNIAAYNLGLKRGQANVLERGVVVAKEIDAILAALHIYEAEIDKFPELWDVATNGGAHELATSEELQDLREMLNFASAVVIEN